MSDNRHPATLLVYGDFNCPWSYLASSRASLLEAAGVSVEWRAVEHAPSQPHLTSGTSPGQALQAELERVSERLLPDEQWPVTAPGFASLSKPAVAGFAEATGVGASVAARQLLYESLWVRGINIGDAARVRALLSDIIRDNTPASDPLRRWGYAITPNGAPVSNTGWQIWRDWRSQWLSLDQRVVPVLVADGLPFFREAAVDRLGMEVAARELDLSNLPVPARSPRHRQRIDLADPRWATQNGGRWLRELQNAHKADPLVSA